MLYEPLMELSDLINGEGKRNNDLKRILHDETWDFPESTATELAVVEVFGMSRKTVQFEVTMHLHILQSNYHMIALLKQLHIEEPDPDVTHRIASYESESKTLQENLIRRYMSGYDAHW